MYFLLGINVGAFFTIPILSNFKMAKFLKLGKKFVDILENRGR